ncbi:hypothetical protein B0H15DRAFT_1023459 [Mycena belliarum]|uniref:Ubiquitin-like domain-containing protein n=1 Tax=Mycena belliarum TaxID=1033014 RepID=A0AAD6U354_9AGAR|nr:hypothetical protein B0H15DRAFT_1023459 [Mycena belliae]
MPRPSPVTDDADNDEDEQPADNEETEPENQHHEEQVAEKVTSDLYSQFTLIRFSTGQLLEDELPLSFYDMQPNELLELHHLGVVVTLPRANLARYLDTYWEGWVRVLRMRPIDDEEDSYLLYKIRPTETRTLKWCDRWLVARLVHTLSLADLRVSLTTRFSPQTGLQPALALSHTGRRISTVTACWTRSRTCSSSTTGACLPETNVFVCELSANQAGGRICHGAPGMNFNSAICPMGSTDVAKCESALIRFHILPTGLEYLENVWTTTWMTLTVRMREVR